MKRFTLIFFLILIIVSFVGCNNEKNNPNMPDTVPSTMDNWGLELNATNIKSTGLTLLFEQFGGNPTGDLQTGSIFWLEVQIDNQWIPVEVLSSEYDLAWTLEAYIINMNDTTELEVNWDWLYGELPIGSYRIGKEVMNFRDTGVYDILNYYADFEIVE